MFKLIFLFFLAILPRIGVIDLVLFLAFCILINDLYLSKKNVYFSVNFLKLTLFLFFLTCTSIVAYCFYEDYFGIIRLVKLFLLLTIVPTALSTIDSRLFHKYFPIFLLITVSILYFEYFNIVGARASINQIHDFLYNGRDVSYRAKGFFAGYSAAGVSCGFIALYALFYTYNKSISPLKGWILFTFSFLATFFTARTGVVIAFLGTFVFLIINFRSFITFKTMLTCLFFALILSIIIFKLNEYLDMDNIGITFIRTFEVFLNYQDSGDLSSESTTQLVRTMSLPSSLFDIFLGNGFEPWSLQSINAGAHQTDSGIFQTIFIYGLVGFFIYYAPIIYVFLNSFLITKNSFLIKNIYLAVVIPLAFVSEIKGHYIYSNLIFVLIVFPFFIGKGRSVASV